MLRAVIFDLDGTLVDTETIWDLAMKELMQKEFHRTFDLPAKQVAMGKPARESARATKEFYGLDIDLDTFIAMREKAFRETRERIGVDALPGADRLVRGLQVAGIPLALATSERHDRAEETLKKFGWEKFFSHIITPVDVAKGKPAPDMFVEAARRLGYDLDDCVAVEDATAGVESANAAGMKVIGVRDSRYGADLSKADLVVASLEQITVDDIKKLVQ